LIVLEGECDVEGIYLREYANPNVERAHFAASDERLNRLFAAGKETYRQNAVDLFTDCPSRERGGWLCDSYFTAQVAPVLSGDTTEERNFLENFLLPESFAHLPEGMLPMCYPADHNDGNFIPNWALWFVLQVEQYRKRSGDLALVEALRPKVLRLFEYFQPFKNEDGLLERLPGLVFVEWSAANDFVQDVNYPSNMLYAAALDTAARMYGLPALRQEAEEIRAVIRKQSFDGGFFVDNAVRKEKKLQVTRNRTEVCQYFAFYFGIATPATYPELWRILREEFGPRRNQTHIYPEIHKANAFVGNMMRLEVLSREGLEQQILDESISYLLYMAERTGTLWENVGASASCNHAFASHIIKSLYRDVLGLFEIDPVSRVVHVRLPEVRLSWCEGSVQVEGGRISLAWRKEGKEQLYRVEIPMGYTLAMEGNNAMWIRES
jgi:alpha-L-rhamnosidase